MYLRVTAILSSEEKTKNLFESVIARISGMAEGIFFKIGLYLPFSKGHLHCKFGAIWIRLMDLHIIM